MDGADQVIGISGRHELADAGLHLLCGLVGKGQTQYAAGLHTQFVHDIRVPVGQGAGLSRPGSGNYPDAPFRGLHCFALPLIQTLQIHIFYQSGFCDST